MLAVGGVDVQAEVDGFAPACGVAGDEPEVGGQGGVAVEVGARGLAVVAAVAVRGQQEPAAVGQGVGVGLDGVSVDGVGEPFADDPEGVAFDAGGPDVAVDGEVGMAAVG